VPVLSHLRTIVPPPTFSPLGAKFADRQTRYEAIRTVRDGGLSIFAAAPRGNGSSLGVFRASSPGAVAAEPEIEVGQAQPHILRTEDQ